MCYRWRPQKPKLASASQMTAFHSEDYIQFLRSIRPENMKVGSQESSLYQIILLDLCEITVHFFLFPPAIHDPVAALQHGRVHGLSRLLRRVRVLPDLLGLLAGGRRAAQPGPHGRGDQLVRRSPPRQEDGGVRVLLRQRYRPRDTGVAQIPSQVRTFS